MSGMIPRGDTADGVRKPIRQTRGGEAVDGAGAGVWPEAARPISSIPVAMGCRSGRRSAPSLVMGVIPLPRRRRAGTATTSTVTRPTVANMGRRRILVIDDERAVRELISDALKIEGHDVHTAENGKEGLDLIGRNPFDLVFCDLRMPEMDGQQLYEEIQRDHPQVLKRICFVTAQANSSDYGPFLRTTGIPVIEKPFTLSQLHQMFGTMVWEMP